MSRMGRARNELLTRRAAIASAAAVVTAGVAVRIEAQTPSATPPGTPATPGASPAASPVASPVPSDPLAIVHASDLSDDGAPVRGGTLRLPVEAASLAELAPTTQRQDPQVAWAYLDGLVRIDAETTLPVPGLATSWQWTDGGTTLTFELRDDVSWHDGTPFTAEDARFTHVAYRDDYRSVVAAQSGLVADVVAVDATTLQVRFDEPDGAWLFNVATLPIVQAAQYRGWWEANPEGERTLDGIDLGGMPPVGTGPWRIESADAAGIGFSRNDDYHEAPPHADRLELLAVISVSDPESMWQRGEVDIAGEVDPQRVDALRQTEGRLVVVDAPRTLFAVFNFENVNRVDPGMLGDPSVRQALSLALDRDRYAEEHWGGFLRFDRAGLVAQEWVEGARQRNPARNLAVARSLLAGAGWADYTGDGVLDSPLGDSLVLTTLVPDTAQPAVRDTLEAMRVDLREIGAELDIQVVSQERFVTWWSTERTWDLLVYDLRLYPAFNEFDLIGSAWDIRVNPDGWNPGGYANPAVDAALAAYFRAVDPSEMAAALADLNAAIVQDPPALWLGFPQELVLLGPRVRGFDPNPLWPTRDTRSLWLTEA